jgi:iron complex transport system substrate-binding protein
MANWMPLCFYLHNGIFNQSSYHIYGLEGLMGKRMIVVLHRVLGVVVVLLCASSMVWAAGAGERAAMETVPATSATLSAIDATGTTVTLSKVPRRILIAGRAAVMPADALFMFPIARSLDVFMSTTDQGLGDFFNLIDPGFIKEKRLSQKAGIEELVALKPDLVLTKTSNYESVAKPLAQFGIPVFVMDLESAGAWITETAELGKLLGDIDTPRRIEAFYREQEETLVYLMQEPSWDVNPTVLVMQVAAADGTTAFSVSPKSWIQTYIVEKAEGTPVWTDSDLGQNAWRRVSFEQIAAWDPDLICLVSYREQPRKFLEEIYSSPQWATLKAVANRNVKAFPSDVLSYAQSDSRWILAFQWLAYELHGQRFQALSMEQEIASFYRTLYHVDDPAVLDALLAAYRTSIQGN